MQLSNITKKYGETVVFTDFTAEFENNAVTWITGTSGKGKTTLLRIIAGLEAFEGSITDKPSDNVSFVFQENRLFEELTPVENCLLVSPKKSVSLIRRLLCETGLEPEQLDRPCSGLSGGQKRRTAVVRALCSDSALLLMDEPFTGLDDDTKKKTAQVIERMLPGRTLIAVTHGLDDPKLISGNVMEI